MLNQYGQVIPWWVQQNQQRGSTAGPVPYAPTTQTPMNWQQNPTNWNQPLAQNPQQYNRPVPSTIPGRIIQNPMEIAPEEVPMNGSVSLFPATDYSYIIAKQWNQNGTITEVRFVPEIQPATDAVEQDPFKKEVLNRLDKLESLLNPPKATSKAKQNSSAKVEVTANE